MSRRELPRHDGDAKPSQREDDVAESLIYATLLHPYTWLIWLAVFMYSGMRKLISKACQAHTVEDSTDQFIGEKLSRSFERSALNDRHRLEGLAHPTSADAALDQDEECQVVEDPWPDYTPVSRKWDAKLRRFGGSW